MNITIRQPSGKKFELKVDESCTVSTLQSLIEKKHGIPISNQRLYHGGKKLTQQNASISQIYNVKEGSVISLNLSVAKPAPVEDNNSNDNTTTNVNYNNNNSNDGTTTIATSNDISTSNTNINIKYIYKYNANIDIDIDTKDDVEDNAVEQTRQVLESMGVAVNAGKELQDRLNEIIKFRAYQWVLAMININNLKSKNTTNYVIGDIVINNVGSTIKDFCRRNGNSMFECFKDDTDGSGDLFALLIFCPKNGDSCKRAIKELITNITQACNVTISVGLSFVQIHNDNSYHTWRERAMINLNECKSYFKNKTNNTDGNETDILYCWPDSEWDYEYNDIKKYKLPTKEKFELKMSSIVTKELQKTAINKESTNKWVLAVMDGDNIKRLKNKNINRARLAMTMIEVELAKLCLKYNGNSNKFICWAYRWGGDEFTMFINNSNNENGKEFIENLMNEFMNNIRNNTEITISIGVTSLLRDELVYEWKRRADKNLEYVKKNGKNSMYWNDEREEEETKTNANTNEQKNVSLY